MRLLFKFYYCLCFPVMHLVYPFITRGRKNLPEGAAVICANHSGYSDSVIALLAFGMSNEVYIMAKADLFDKFFIGCVLRSMGCIPIKREESTEIQAIRAALTYLKAGKKVLIFPEGTRVKAKGEVKPKEGPVRIANKVGAPVVPMFISGNKKVFHPIKVIIGKPYHIAKPEDRNFAPAAEGLLDIIYGLENTI